MNVLVPGGHGQLGRALARMGARTGHVVIAPSRSELDIATMRPDLAGIDVVINAAAYTSVDGAETDREAAFATNAIAAGALATACAAARVPLVHVSTDFVFDGSDPAPLAETATPAPLNVYGASKLEGEHHVIAAGGSVVRTSWLFGPGSRGFVTAIANAARRGEPLAVVTDQIGRPTYADHLADALLRFAARGDRPSLLHYAGDRAVSRYDFARAIVGALGVDVPVTATTTGPTPARRPPRAILDCTLATHLGLPPRSWRAGLAEMFA